MSKPTPVILFVYNRPQHTEKTLFALSENELADVTTLYIFADGPKTGASEAVLQKIKQTREVISSKKWCGEVIIRESAANKGLANSVVEGVTEIVNKYGRVIVMEDDLVTSRWFLRFMNDALDVYENEKNVACISGYIYPVKSKLPETFFVRGADCWGWGTWKRAWDIFEKEEEALISELKNKNLTSRFDFDNSYSYMQMLLDKSEGKNDSWAINWYASAFLKNMLCLYPGTSLVQNIGNDGSGTHSKKSLQWEVKTATERISVIKIPVQENENARKSMIAHFRSLSKKSWKQSLKKYIPAFLKKQIRQAITPKKKHGWFGNYRDWKSAAAKCTGYDDRVILDKVLSSVLKVKNGEAAYERDSVLFDEIQVNDDLLNALLAISRENSGVLHVSDFGGSLGSTYFQNRNFLKDIKDLKWAVVEQSHFVEAGKQKIAEGPLQFYHTIQEVISVQKPHVLLLSSVLQYFEDPPKQIKILVSCGYDYIIVDRTSFIDTPAERITVQVVPEEVYKASYPAWFFNEGKFIAAFEGYDLISKFDSKISLPYQLDTNTIATWKGFIFKRKK